MKCSRIVVLWWLVFGCVYTVWPQEAVPLIAEQRFAFNTPSGSATLPIKTSVDWNKKQPGITRAIVLLHGRGRDAEGYYRGLGQARYEAADAGLSTVLVVPQFLNEIDVQAHDLPESIVRWRIGTWESGASAIGPARISAYEVLDAILEHLSDRTIFPNLVDIVLAGHSGGGQAVQRYAVVGKEVSQVIAGGIHLRFVIANPSSYLYFSDERPLRPGTDCENWNRWKYGIRDAPKYVVADTARYWKDRESDYVRTDVVYLLGDQDTNPADVDLDVSCGAESQGRTRLQRGLLYFRYLRSRNVGRWNQQLWIVKGVGHSGPKMIESPCGVDALFAIGTCAPGDARRVRRR